MINYKLLICSRSRSNGLAYSSQIPSKFYYRAYGSV
jgi:hypothetical protein